jgi:glycosyltransferase involved in cell wall biosynthesis
LIETYIKTLTYIVLGTAGFSLLVQLIYYWAVFAWVSFFKNKKAERSHSDQPPVSIVISARNEYLKLERNLPLLFAQDYQDFEVVVVNDCSDDGSEEMLDDYARREPRLKLVHIRQSLNFFQGKKFPLSIGIKSAKNEILLLTDADCAPRSNQWINAMVASYREKTEMVLGYGPYQKKSGILNLLIRFDTLHIGLQYLSYALAGAPYMGVGRNLSYRKSLFLKNKGFTSHYSIPSGDDDLFVAKVANKKNTRIVIHEDSRTYSEPSKNFAAWVRQKRRHLSTGKYYSGGVKFKLGLYYFTQFSFYAACAGLYFLPIHFVFPTAMLAFRLINQLIIFGAASKRLGERSIWLITPFAELFFMFFNPIIAFTNIFSKQVRWK